MECSRKIRVGSEGGRALLLDPECHVPLRPIHGDRAAGANSAYLVSPNTLGQESTVTLTFEKQGEDTLMTLVHSDLPDNELARGMRMGGATFWKFIVSNLELPSTNATPIGPRRVSDANV